VRADEATAQQLGINAVPFFVIDRAFGVSGAQDPQTLLRFLEHGWEAGAAVGVTADGAGCAVDGC
jgi:predicted DsbA family dithiol-disulfide isomerase